MINSLILTWLDAVISLRPVAVAVVVIVLILPNLWVIRKHSRIRQVVFMGSLILPAGVFLISARVLGYGYLSSYYDPQLSKSGQYLVLIDSHYEEEGSAYRRTGSSEDRRLYLIDLDKHELFFKRPVGNDETWEVAEEQIRQRADGTAGDTLDVKFARVFPVKETGLTPDKKEAEAMPNIIYCPLWLKGEGARKRLMSKDSVELGNSFNEGEMVTWFAKPGIAVIRSISKTLTADKKKQQILTAVTAQGSVLWKKHQGELKASAYATRVRYAFAHNNDLMILLGNFLMKINVKNGAVIWEKPL